LEKLSRLERLAVRLEEVGGESLRDEVMGDYQGLSSASTPSRKAKWAAGMLERMAACLDQEAQLDVMRSSCCPYRKDMIEDYRQLFAQTHSMDLLLETMRENTRAMIDRSLRKDSALQEQVQYHAFYHSPMRSGLIVSFFAFPYHIADYLREPQLEKRRKHACHCGWISASKENYPLTYCACGTGFYQQLWEGILGQEVEITVEQSVMHGDECCQFNVRLPASVLQ
jgi:hypothetical protein